MARILRGVKSPLPLSGRGGGLFSFLPSLCLPFVGLPFLCPPSLWAILAVLHGFLDGCNFWPFLPSLLACVAFSRVGCGFAWVGCFCGLVGLFCGCYSFCLRAVSTCKGKKAAQIQKSAFCPCVPPSVFCCVSVQRETKRKTALLLGRFFLGCGGVWFLLFGTESVKTEHCKRGGLFAKYPYFFGCVVCLHLAGGGACDII